MKCHSQECLSVQTNFIEVFFSKGVYFSMDKQVQRSVHFSVQECILVWTNRFRGVIIFQYRSVFQYGLIGLEECSLFSNDQAQSDVFLQRLGLEECFSVSLGLEEEECFSVDPRFRRHFFSSDQVQRTVCFSSEHVQTSIFAVDTRFRSVFCSRNQVHGVFVGSDYASRDILFYYSG